MVAEIIAIIKDVSIIGLVVTATALLVVLTVGLIKLFPSWRRTSDNLERSTAATAKISEDFAAVSEDVAQNLAKLTKDSAQTAENLKESTSLLANISSLNLRAMFELLRESNVNNVRDSAQGYRIWILRGQLTVKSPFLTAKFG